jgi:hypothetical protein
MFALTGTTVIFPGILHFFNCGILFLEKGLNEAICLCREATEIPISDYLYLWKSFCSKVKSHPVFLTPDSLDNCIDSSLLEEMLRLGQPLTDQSSVGNMRDSYIIMLFTLENCLKCFESGDLHFAVFLLPWALQEEVIPSTSIPRDERLFKAIVNFKLLMRLFHLSDLPHAPGITKRVNRLVAKALTFADDSQWPRVLSSSLALIQFVLDGESSWCFSLVGTHCFENFFGLICGHSFGDHRFQTAERITMRTALVALILHRCNLEIRH